MVQNYLPSLDGKRKLTEQQQKFLDALSSEAKGDINKALELAGYQPGASYSVVNSLKDEIIDVATKILAKSAPQGAYYKDLVCKEIILWFLNLENFSAS